LKEIAEWLRQIRNVLESIDEKLGRRPTAGADPAG
jgi:hypothetical protein